MQDGINGSVKKALDDLFQSCDENSSEKVFFIRFYNTFNESTRPIYSITDLKGMKPEISKQKETEEDIERLTNLRKRKVDYPTTVQEDSGLICADCGRIFSRREHVRRHKTNESCKGLEKNIEQKRESDKTSHLLTDKRVPKGSPGFAALQALFEEKGPISKQELKLKAQRYLENTADLEEWKTTWSKINALSGKMGLIEKFGHLAKYSITKKGRDWMEREEGRREKSGPGERRQREEGSGKRRQRGEGSGERRQRGEGNGERRDREEGRRERREEGGSHPSGLGLMANLGSSCNAGAVIQGLIATGLDQALDHRVPMDPQYANLHRVLEEVGNRRRDPSTPPVDPISVIEAVNAVTPNQWKVDISESATDFLESVLDSVELLPQSLTTFQEVGTCGYCSRNYTQVSRLNHYWISVPVKNKGRLVEPVAGAQAMLESLPSSHRSLYC